MEIPNEKIQNTETEEIKEIREIIENSNLGLYLKTTRKKIGATQKHVANKLQISESYINLIENNQKIPSLELIIKFLSLYCNISKKTIIEILENPKTDEDFKLLRIFKSYITIKEKHIYINEKINIEKIRENITEMDKNNNIQETQPSQQLTQKTIKEFIEEEVKKQVATQSEKQVETTLAKIQEKVATMIGQLIFNSLTPK